MTDRRRSVSFGRTMRLPHAASAAAARRADAIVAAVLAAIALAQVLVIAPVGARWIGALLALGSTIPIAFRRTAPAAAALAGTVVWLLPADGYVWVGYIAAFILYYSAAAHIADPRTVAALVLLGVGVSIVATLAQDEVVGEYFGAVSAVAGPALVGRVVRHTREQAQRLRALSAELELERDRSARAAVGEERARIARELHDVVAHGLSVIAIQADAAEAALERDPARVRAPLAAIRASARDALVDMRRMLGMLREPETPDGDGDGAAPLAPQPGLDQLPALLDRARAAGLAVELEVRGEPQPLPGSLDLSAYRILQEALTNVSKHAPRAPATVALDWRDAALGLAVSNPMRSAPDRPDGPESGHGLLGMRERARLHGGRLDAGPTGRGGFEVRAELPL
jgi:signal transduction histidine kinase